jgi:hypothetical protein
MRSSRRDEVMKHRIIPGKLLPSNASKMATIRTSSGMALFKYLSVANFEVD